MIGAFPSLSGVVLAVASDGAYILIIGILLAKHWLEAEYRISARPAIEPIETMERPQLGSLLLSCIIVLALADIARLWFITTTMSGLTLWKDVIPLIPQVLNATHQGEIWYFTASATLVLLAAILALNRGSASNRGSHTVAKFATVACVCLLGFAKAASGHAADEGDFTLIEMAQMLHILATAVWAGSILISGWLIVPGMAKLADKRDLAGYGSRLSKTATYAVMVILASGIFTADRELDSRASGLWTSAWGRVLSVKLVFVLLALLLGAYNRLVCLKRLEDEGNGAFFVRGARAEAAAMTVIVCISALLGGMSPPMLPPM